MAVRRSALERIGGFDESVPIYGDEEEWLMRLHAAGGRVAYVAAAGLEHRRAGRRRAPALARARRVPPRARGAAQRPPQGQAPRAGDESCATWPAPAGTPSAGAARRGW